MPTSPDDLMLVTGATGLVGSHVVERARSHGIPTRALVRPSSDTRLLEEWGVETVRADLTDADALSGAVRDVSLIVHCAAKVGDWGPVDEYRRVNVGGLENLLKALQAKVPRTLQASGGLPSAGEIKRFVHVSSLGVYQARDHHGTDESEPPCAEGIDGYTLSKVESEQVVLRHVREHNLPAVVLRPGFIYGPRDRTVLPRLLERLRDGKFAFLGSGEKLMNNTYVGNLVDAVFAAIDREDCVGGVYNIADGRLVSKKEFIATIAGAAGHPVPTRHVPLGLARLLAWGMEGAWRLLGKKEAPLLSRARVKFLGLNLDFCIDRARRELGYEPRVDFREGMRETVASLNGMAEG